MDVATDTPMADVKGWGWQGSCKTIKERTTYMLDHSPIPFNVKFRVHLPGKTAVTIEAHKDVLAIGSEVFLAMFYGGLAKNKKVIDIPDTDPRAFRLLMRFLYTEKLSTAMMENDISLAFEVMKCAGKYGVPYLYIQCRQWIVQHFVEKFEDKEKVKTDALLYLQTALKAEYEDHKILEAIWSEIDVRAESVLQTPDEVLRDVSLEVLTMFLARDSLTVLKEKHLYDFMTRWAKLQTSEGDITGLTLRGRLGDAVKSIRYTLMEPSEFSNGPVADEVLTFEEAVQVYRHQFAPVPEEKFRFLSRRRESTSPPTMLRVNLGVLEGRLHLDTDKFYPFAMFTIQMTELHSVLMDYVYGFSTSILETRLTATWSRADNSNSKFSKFTARIGDALLNEYSSGSVIFEFQDEHAEVLEAYTGQVVSLGLGDVAMEVAYTERGRGEEKFYRTETISLIFGGYSRSTYTSPNQNNSVFYLGHIVRGPTDFSFLHHVVRRNKLLPVEAGLWFSAKHF